MQTMRREWINEGKPQESFEENRQLDTHAPGSRPKSPAPQERSSAAVTSQERPTTPVIGIPNDNDLYSATPRKTPDGIDPPRNSDRNEDLFLSGDENNKQPSEDDLDALLAEDEQMRSKKVVQGDVNVNQDRTGVDDNFDDEMEAMAEMDDLW